MGTGIQRGFQASQEETVTRRLMGPGAMRLDLWVSLPGHAGTTLTVASFPRFDESVMVAIPESRKKFPDVEIKLVGLACPDHHPAMTTALATGAKWPDVMAVEIGCIGQFAESGGLEVLGAAPYSVMPYQKQFARFTHPQAMSGEGKLAAIPADIGPGALFVRKDLLDQAGVTAADLTRSWDGFVEAGKKVKAATGACMSASAVDLKHTRPPLEGRAGEAEVVADAQDRRVRMEARQHRVADGRRGHSSGKVFK